MTNLIALCVCTAYVSTSHVAADGHYPVAGLTCAGPRWVPLGTRVHIESVGWRTVTDRTHLRFNGRYDVFMASRAEAIKFGRRELKVTIAR